MGGLEREGRLMMKEMESSRMVDLEGRGQVEAPGGRSTAGATDAEMGGPHERDSNAGVHISTDGGVGAVKFVG